MGFALAAVFFVMFWRHTKDRLFGFFSLSFFVLAVNRIALGLRDESPVGRDQLYWIRFVAFAVILLAIVDKNRSSPPQGP